MNKKAEEPASALSTIITVLAVSLILILATIALVKWIYGETPIEVCRLSVLANSKVHEINEKTGSKGAEAVGEQLMGISLSKDIPLECPASNIELSGDLKTQEYQIAEELRSCWYKMGMGNLEVFGTEYLISQGNYCLVCSEFASKDEIQPLIFLDYLKTTNAGNTGKTYSQYLAIGKEEKLAATGIKPNTDYLIVYLRSSKSYAGTAITDYFYPGTGIENQSMIVVPKPELANSKLCDKLYWERAEK